MPYSLEEAKLKSDFYRNQLDSDLIEFENRIRDLKAKQQISGSADANKPLRGEDGKLISFQSTTNVSSSAETDLENVRIPNEQQFFTGELDNSFTYYFQPEQDDNGDTGEDETEDEQNTQVEFQATNRDYLIQLVNVYFDESYTPLMSIELLHNKILDFFKQEANQGGKNADGWEAFRLNKKRKVVNWKLKLKSKIFGKSSRYSRAKRDLKNFTYDEVIENHIYRIRRGQEIWLQLGFPYVTDKTKKDANE
jgi:hypothetical protein|tara:strand:+ start:1650 stop:2402 length:753 start_codon:yes stop_codon:yes gene_type:complete